MRPFLPTKTVREHRFSHRGMRVGSNYLQRVLDDALCGWRGLVCRDPHALVSAYRDVPTAGYGSGSSATQWLCDAVGHRENAPSS